MSATTATSAAALLERDAELDGVHRAIADADAGLGRLVVIDGPAGVGKTSLLIAARDAARDAGLLTLRARGAELEREFAFGVMRQLFDDVVRGRAVDSAGLFAGAARQAAPLLGVEVDGAPSTPSEDAYAARYALFWLAANLAAERPLAMIVDDSHWADAESLAAIAHLANRLEGLPILLVVASRSEESSAALAALRRQAHDAGTHMVVAPLGEDGATAVVRSIAPDADDELCRACFRASGGNPFLLNELSRSVLSGRGRPLSAGHVADQSPERVTREVADRLARLPAPAGRLARAAAVLGPGVPLRQAAQLAGVDPQDAAVAADALVRAGVLRKAGPLEFLHPLLRTAVYDGLGQATRARDHSRAARLLVAEAAPPERVAAQLLNRPPAGDAWACDQLLAAARLASTRGAGEAAARYLRRALDEDPPPDQRTPILLELGLAESMASDPVGAIDHLREALAAELGVEERLQATILLTGLLGHTYRVPEAVDMLEAEIERLDDRPDLRRVVEVAITNIARIDSTMQSRRAPFVARLRAAVQSGEPQDASVLGAVATEMAMAGEPVARTTELAERAVGGFVAVGAGVTDWSFYSAARTLLISESYDSAIRALTRVVEQARERGGMLDTGGGLVFRAEAYLRMGDLANAEVDARTLLGISTDYGWPIGIGFAAAWLCEILVERGELDEAERLLEDAPGGIEALTSDFTGTEVLLARGGLRLAQGHLQESVDDLRASGRSAVAIGNVNPAVCGWRSELAHGLIQLGQTAEARRLAEESLEMARLFGAPRAIAVALRAAGRVDGGQHEIRMLREAVDLLKDSPAQLECGRANAALGAALRRVGWNEDAREPLRVAVDLAHRCGARALEDQALDELRATGARPRRRAAAGIDALTASERRIAEAAAAGQQNREIAQSLFVTAHTVEFHLRNAYRKLGIKGRAALGAALAKTP